MICIICEEAETLPGLTSILLERDEHSLTFNNVPAQICPNCGEAYAEESVTANLLREAERMARAGEKMEVLEYEPITVLSS
ncbi:MAG: type II toxin-antitoxin system MqsA family antitoxin [Anaerolineales bacterium]|nr:type II toxin-antitoxin system MqsA family antitoxin [Anaerolineales bacterium]